MCYIESKQVLARSRSKQKHLSIRKRTTYHAIPVPSRASMHARLQRRAPAKSDSLAESAFSWMYPNACTELKPPNRKMRTTHIAHFKSKYRCLARIRIRRQRGNYIIFYCTNTAARPTATARYAYITDGRKADTDRPTTCTARSP
jgi:hypothetical protein